MRTAIPEKLFRICDDIDKHGNVSLTRLTVIKKWFNTPQRLAIFGFWIASRASSRKGKTTGVAAQLFKESRKLLSGVKLYDLHLDRDAAQRLHDCLKEFQNDHKSQTGGSIRIIHNWNLFLVEKGLNLYLSGYSTSAMGYKLAADYCQNYDPQYGNGLNGPSMTKMREIVRFMFAVEAQEDLV